MDLINLLAGDKSALLTSGFVDDFDYLSLAETGSAGRWNTLDADSGASVAHDADGLDGRVLLTTGATDNNEAYLYSNEVGQFLNGKPMLMVVRLQYAESATDDANVIFGLVETVGANTLQDDGAGPPADYDGAVLFKADGDTRWSFETSQGTSQTTTETNKTAGGTSFQTLAILGDPISSSEMLVTPWIDTAGGNALVQPPQQGANARTPLIQHRVGYDAGNMSLVVGVKAGSGSSEVVTVDLAIFRKKR